MTRLLVCLRARLAAMRLDQDVEDPRELLVGHAPSPARSRLVRDDEVELGEHGDMLPHGAQTGERAFVRPRCPLAVPHPPEIAVSPRTTEMRGGMHLRHVRHDARDSVEPIPRLELAAGPVAL